MYMLGLDMLGADAVTTAAAASQQKAPTKSSDGGMSWYTIGGIALTIVVMVVALPHLLKD